MLLVGCGVGAWRCGDAGGDGRGVLWTVEREVSYFNVFGR